MKNVMLLIFLILCAVSSHAQSRQAADKAEAEQTVVEFFEAFSNRDSVAMRSYCTGDVVLFEYGAKWNLDTLIERGIVKNQATDFKRTNTFEFVNTRIHENTAWTTYNLHSTINSNNTKRTIHWLETIVLIRMEKKWRIALLHSALIKRM